MMYKKFIQLCFFPIFILIGCISHLQPYEKVTYDTGYIDNDTLQLVLKVNPAREAEGLVAQRESAYAAAVKNLNEHLSNELVRYCFDQNKQINGQTAPLQAGEVMNSVKNPQLAIASITKSGHKVAQFFDEDNALIITYRIKKIGLRNTLEDLTSGIKTK